jgi:hypothetical protein
MGRRKMKSVAVLVCLPSCWNWCMKAVQYSLSQHTEHWTLKHWASALSEPRARIHISVRTSVNIMILIPRRFPKKSPSSLLILTYSTTRELYTRLYQGYTPLWVQPRSSNSILGLGTTYNCFLTQMTTQQTTAKDILHFTLQHNTTKSKYSAQLLSPSDLKV